MYIFKLVINVIRLKIITYGYIQFWFNILILLFYFITVILFILLLFNEIYVIFLILNLFGFKKNIYYKYQKWYQN